MLNRCFICHEKIKWFNPKFDFNKVKRERLATPENFNRTAILCKRCYERLIKEPIEEPTGYVYVKQTSQTTRTPGMSQEKVLDLKEIKYCGLGISLKSHMDYN